MYYLEDPKRKFTLFWNFRVASRSLDKWFFDLGHDEPLPHNQSDSYKKVLESERSIIVVRDPLDRFISMLNHPSAFQYEPTKYLGKDRVNEFLTLLETKGISDAHFDLQCQFLDNMIAHETEDVSKLFTHIIKVEDGSAVDQLNTLLDLKGSDVYINTSLEKKLSPVNRHSFSYTGLDLVSKESLTKEQINRVKKLYHYDFLNFYPQ